MKSLALALSGALLLSAPTLADDGEPSLTDLVAASGGVFDTNFFDYDLLLNAVIAADLAETLDSDTLDVTLFAPNDLAFIRLARDLGYRGFDEAGSFDYIVGALTELGGGDPIPLLTEILTYHVATESLSPLEVIFSKTIDTLQGAVIRPFFIVLRDEEPDLRDPLVFYPLNVQASNGVLHTVTRVLIPIDIP